MKRFNYTMALLLTVLSVLPMKAKDFIEVAGTKWATGNLQYTGGKWRIAPTQTSAFSYKGGSGDNQVALDTSVGLDYFSFGTVGQTAIDGDYCKGVAPDLTKMYSDINCNSETTDSSAAVCGDVAAWATHGLYRLPTKEEFDDLLAKASRQYGYVNTDGKKIYGFLFTDPTDGKPTVSNSEREITQSELENGLFLPCAGLKYLNYGQVYHAGSSLCYLTSTPWPSKDAYRDFYALSLNKEEGGVGRNLRWLGWTVRPVYTRSGIPVDSDMVVVTLKEAGTLSSTLENGLNVKKLKIIGNINGTDINYLQKMLGYDKTFRGEPVGVLTDLDLSDARIVSGGESYGTKSEGGVETEMFTSDDELGDFLFAYVPNLQKIVLPTGIKTIGTRPFQGCDKLQKIIADGKNYADKDGVLFTKDGKKLVLYPIAYSPKMSIYQIPDGTTTIGESAFLETTTANIIIPNTLTTIEGYAFDNSNISQLNLPASVTSIDPTAYAAVTLTRITVDEANPAFSAADNVLYNKDKTALLRYASMQTKKSFDIPQTVTSIGDYAFYRATMLKNLTIPSQLKSVGDYAICQTGIKSIDLPETVDEIGDDALSYNDSLTTVTLPSKVSKMGTYALSENGELLSADLPEGVTDLTGMFYDDLKLTKVTIPQTVKTVGYGAFYNCQSLLAIDVPETVDSIGQYAFEFCSRIDSLSIPEGVKTLPYACFMWDRGLEKISLPSTLAYVGDFAFVGTGMLAEVKLPAVTPPAVSEVNVFFQSNPGNCKLLVPKASVDAYKAAYGWKDFQIEGYDFPTTDGISRPTVSNSTEVVARYDVAGNRITGAHRGLEIQRLADGTTRKVLVR